MRIIEIGKNIQQKEGFKVFVPYHFPPKNVFNSDAKIIKKQ